MSMLYPRITEAGELVEENQMVSAREHLYVNHRIIKMAGEITEETLSTDLLLALDSLSHDPIKVLITSPGGWLDGTFLLCDMFNLMQSPIYTIGRYCCSAATLILASGNKRYLFPHAQVMMHLPSGQLMGDSKDIDIQRIQIQKKQDAIITLLQERGVKRTKEQILEDIDRDYWMDAQEAIDYGLADEIITPELMKEWLGGGEQ